MAHGLEALGVAERMASYVDGLEVRKTYGWCLLTSFLFLEDFSPCVLFLKDFLGICCIFSRVLKQSLLATTAILMLLPLRLLVLLLLQPLFALL